MTSKNLRITSIILVLTFCLTFLTACGKKDKNVASDAKGADSSAKASTSSTTAEIDSLGDGNGTSTSNNNESVANDSTSKSTSKASSTTTKNSSKAKTTITATVPSRTPEKSGLNNTPSAVENAKSIEDLANIAPEQAAKNSYDTDASVSSMQEKTINPNEFTYIPYNQFEQHITSVWSNFITTEKVIVDAQYENEYLNYLCLPVKNSFCEINCHGYSAMHGYDQSGTYAYIEVTWVYYLNASQYSSCKNAATQIVNSTSGSTVDRIRAIHDYLAKNNTYALNVDGAYNCLINHKSDCDGYTAAFQICMELLGVPCKAYTTTDHIFNMVQVGGKWYVVDVTYDDQTDKYGFIYTRYFLAGSSMYTNYPILVNLLSSTDYNCSRKLVITDDALFRSYTKIGNSNYTLNDDSSVTVEGKGILRIY